MRIILTVTEGPHAGQVFAFTEHDNFIVGRSARARFQLHKKDQYFSRFHFMVEANPPRCRLVDLDSRNGTVVNGQAVRTTELHDGDEIRAGRTVFRVAIEAAGGEDEAPTAEDPGPVTAAVPAALTTTYEAGALCPACAQASSVGLLCADCQALADQEPQTVPGYVRVRELGRGQMGVVHLAVHEASGTPVALKTILPAGVATGVQLQRFLREAAILKDLEHPHVVRFLDMGATPRGQLYFVMEYLAGTDARQLVRKQGPLDVRLAVRILLPVLDALAYAHGKGIVHRDVKPGNVLVGREGGKARVKLADFGLARAYQASRLSGLTLTGEHGGTPAFLPPEQLLDFRSVQPAADQFSAAATLYFLLTDRLLFDNAKNVERLLSCVLQEPPVPLLRRRPDLPPDLAAAVHRALAKKPEERFPDVAALRKALTPFGKGVG